MANKSVAVKPDVLAIQWTEKRVLVSALRPYERNPRRISKEAFSALKKSLAETGYHQRICVNSPTELKIWGGHQRLQALKELGIQEIAVLVPDRELTEDEFRRLLIQDNLPFGEFDDDLLANDFDVEELKDWGAPDWMLGEIKEAPDEFPEVDEDIETEHTCPKCGFKFSGGKETPVKSSTE